MGDKSGWHLRGFTFRKSRDTQGSWREGHQNRDFQMGEVTAPGHLLWAAVQW